MRTTLARGNHLPWLFSPLILFCSSLCLGSAQPAPAPKLVFEWHREYSFADMLRHAPVVVIGQVKYIKYTGPIITAADDHGNEGEWQLQEIGITVEVPVKGAITSPDSKFYFYVWLGGTTGDWNALHVGDRCIFFLKKDNGVLRAVRDYERSSIEVGSGRHYRLPLSGGNSVEERLIALLLTPGEDLDPLRFRRTLLRVVAVSEDWIGPCRTAELLRMTVPRFTGSARADIEDQIGRLLKAAGPCRSAK